jgi:hypothetical protein
VAQLQQHGHFSLREINVLHGDPLKNAGSLAVVGLSDVIGSNKGRDGDTLPRGCCSMTLQAHEILRSRPSDPVEEPVVALHRH